MSVKRSSLNSWLFKLRNWANFTDFLSDYQRISWLSDIFYLNSISAVSNPKDCIIEFKNMLHKMNKYWKKNTFFQNFWLLMWSRGIKLLLKFLIFISLQPDGENLWYCKCWLLLKFIGWSWKMKGLRQ